MSTIPVASSISGSVGRGGVNDRTDVLTVQRLINAKLPAPLTPLDEDGVCGPLTIQAIEDIQRSNLRMLLPDGRIDPTAPPFDSSTVIQFPFPRRCRESLGAQR